jgi:hypothetical protein
MQIDNCIGSLCHPQCFEMLVPSTNCKRASHLSDLWLIGIMCCDKAVHLDIIAHVHDFSSNVLLFCITSSSNHPFSPNVLLYRITSHITIRKHGENRSHQGMPMNLWSIFILYVGFETGAASSPYTNFSYNSPNEV